MRTGWIYCDASTPFKAPLHGPEVLTKLHCADLEEITSAAHSELGLVLLRCRHCGNTQPAPMGEPLTA
jgi:hypothetical protein